MGETGMPRLRTLTFLGFRKLRMKKAHERRDLPKVTRPVSGWARTTTHFLSPRPGFFLLLRKTRSAKAQGTEPTPSPRSLMASVSPTTPVLRRPGKIRMPPP